MRNPQQTHIRDQRIFETIALLRRPEGASIIGLALHFGISGRTARKLIWAAGERGHQVARSLSKFDGGAPGRYYIVGGAPG